MENKNKVFLSIIIPAFNAEHYIFDCLNSLIKNVGIDDYEILVVNNNSTDNTAQICQNFNDKHVKILMCKEKGVAYARNMGLDNALGEFVTFADADDVVDEKFANAVDIVRNNTVVDVFMFPTFLISNFRNSIIYELPLEFQMKTINKFSNEFINLLNKKLANSCWNKIIKTDFVKKHSINFNQFTNAEDMEFVSKLLLNCDSVFYANIPYYHYIVRENSAMTQIKLVKLMDAISACCSAFVNLDNSDNISIAKKLKYFVSRTAFFTLTKYKHLSKMEKTQFCKFLQDKLFLFNYTSTKSHKIIKFLLNCFGVKFTLNLIALFVR